MNTEKLKQEYLEKVALGAKLIGSEDNNSYSELAKICDEIRDIYYGLIERGEKISQTQLNSLNRLESHCTMNLTK